jgi:hypothetical protein
MFKRSLYTFLATAAISTSAMIAPALVTPAAAQVGVSVNVGLPAVPMPFAVVQQPGYLYNAGYRGEGEHRYWEHGRWAERRHEERRFEEHRFDEHHGWDHRR